MKVSRAQAEHNRERIIATAGELFREKGFDGIGLNDLMQAAGLTRGGFYGHFESKQDLAVQACRQALAANAETWRERAGALDLAALAGFYLSDQHHDNRSRGCTLTALCADAARQGPALQAVFEQGVTNFLRVLEPLVAGDTPAQRRETALASMATLVGALLLSRAVADPVLSAQIRAAAAAAVLAQPRSQD